MVSEPAEIENQADLQHGRNAPEIQDALLFLALLLGLLLLEMGDQLLDTLVEYLRFYVLVSKREKEIFINQKIKTRFL